MDEEEERNKIQGSPDSSVNGSKDKLHESATQVDQDTKSNEGKNY